jgi:hypothetical protein
MKAQRLTVFSFLVSMTLLALLAPCMVRLTAAPLEQTAPLAPALSRAEGPAPIPTITGPTGGPTNAVAPAATTADAENVELVGHIGGVTYAVFVQGTYAYIGVGPRLTILDVSTPISPTVVGKTHPLPDLVRDVYVSGGYAYVADYHAGLRVVDVSTPVTPAEVGFYDKPGSAHGVAVAGGYAYVADNGGLRVVDVSNPTAPAEVGFYDTPGWANDVAVAGGYAYVADADEGLRVVDVSAPAGPVEVGFYDTPGFACGVAVAGGYAYVTDEGSGLRVVDVSNPAAPVEVGFYDTPGYARGVAVAGGYAYVADDGSLRVVDVSNPAAPTEVGFYGTPGYAEDVAVAGDYAYVADTWSPLWVVDVSSPAAPAEVGFYNTLGMAHGVAVAGSYAYVVDAWDRDLWVVDVSNPATPVEVGLYNTPGHGSDVVVRGDYAYVADGDVWDGSQWVGGDLRIIDISDPATLTEVGFYDTPGGGQGVAVAGDYAYVADTDRGLRVVNVSNPTAPVEVGFCETRDSAHNVAVAGDYAYVTHNPMWDGSQWVGGGLQVVEVSDPAVPTEVGFYDTPGWANDVAVAGGYANIADAPVQDGSQWANGGLRVVDVSNPAAPVESGFFETPRFAEGVAVAGGYAYVADGDGGGLRVVDVSNPAALTEVGFYNTLGWAEGVTVVGSYAFVADYYGGLFIVHFVPSPTDAHEPDDLCAQARTIPTDGTVQVHTFHDEADADWVTFDAISGTTYLIEAQIPAGSPADVVLELYDQCDAPPQGGQDPAFSPGVRLEFPAPADGPLYLKLLNHDPTVYGPEVVYHLSVRALDDAPSPGAVVLVAGKLRDNDPLQDNIHHVTDAVYCLFQAYGYDGDRVHYLATDATLDADDDGTPDVDAPPSPANLEQAITSWAVDKVGPDRAFTLYLMDHGGYDLFYLDGSTQTVSPDELDGWLETLEAAAPGVKVNVIVEACHSGSFIDSASAVELIQTVSKPGRVVIASTGAYALAYATDEGAAFSDPFLQALALDLSLYASFQEARWAVQEAHPDQTPWLDDDGDGVPNEGEEGEEAARRGFAYAGTFGDVWPPYVVWAEIGEIQHGTGDITAEVRDDVGVSEVWAVIYPPSYQPPDPATTEELVLESLTTVPLSDTNGDGVYSAVYDGFDETGAYRVVVYAVDGEGLVGRPKGAEVHRLYLPLVVRNYTPPVTFPVHIGDAIPQRAVAYQGEVFYITSVLMPETLPSSGRFYFSAQRNAVAEVLVDDELAVLVDGTEVFTHRFSSGDTPPQAAIVEVPRATMEGLVGRAVTVEYRDVYGVLVEASAMWLIWTP